MDKLPKAEQDEAFISPYLKIPPRTLEDVLRQRNRSAMEIVKGARNPNLVEGDKA